MSALALDASDEPAGTCEDSDIPAAAGLKARSPLLPPRLHGSRGPSPRSATTAQSAVALVHAAPRLPSPSLPCTWRCTQAVKPLRRRKRRFGQVLAHRGAMNPVTSHGGRVLQRGKCALHGGCVLHTGDVCFGGGTGGL